MITARQQVHFFALQVCLYIEPLKIAAAKSRFLHRQMHRTEFADIAVLAFVYLGVQLSLIHI